MARIILKISGEALKQDDKIVDVSKLKMVLETINILKKYDSKIAIIVGGGNIFRGRSNLNMKDDNSTAIGVSGSIINALYLKDYLENNNLNVVLSTPFKLNSLIKEYTDEEMLNKFNNGDIVIFGGGVGKIGYSTDSGVILANSKLNCDLIIKMTNVDGVYSEDPKINNDAIKYNKLSYQKVLEDKLNIMDEAAIKNCMENDIKILVMNFNSHTEIEKYFKNEEIGTIIGE